MRIRFARLANIMSIRKMVSFERQSTNCIVARGRIEIVLYIYQIIFSVLVRKTSPIGKDKSKTSCFIVYRKLITIELIDRDQYQRNETFLIRLGEPSLIKDETEDEKLSML
jgi:hypothetical protein